MKVLVLMLTLLLSSSSFGQGVYNPVLRGAYGGMGTWSGYNPNYRSAYYRPAYQRYQYRRWRARYRNPYLDRRISVTFEDWDVAAYNAIRNHEHLTW